MMCDQCGYRPQKRDRAFVVLNEGTDNYEIPIVYVRCYKCGHEWIE